MNSWQLKKLGLVCDLISGLWTGKEPPFIKVGVIRNTNFTKEGELDDSDIAYLDVEQKQFGKRKLKYGDIILEKSGGGPKQPVGRVVAFDKQEGDYSFSNFTSAIRIKNAEELDFNFLHKFLFFSYITGATEKMQSHSTGIRNLDLNAYKKIEIPVPPLPEQQRIVELLDEIFSKISKAKENAEKNLQNAKELFESYLQNVFANPWEDWEGERLINLTLKIGSGATPRGGKESYKRDGIALVRSMNVHDRNFVEKNLAFIDDGQANDLSNVILERGDVLLNITGASVARCCVFPERYLPARVNQHVSILRPKQELVDSFFLNYLLTSKFYKDRLLTIGEQGATRQAITKAQLEDFSISFPSLSTQKSIVARLDALSSETKKLEAIYKQKLADLDELKRSVLRKAFAGEL